jgi:hypothetical protein
VEGFSAWHHCVDRKKNLPQRSQGLRKGRKEFNREGEEVEEGKGEEKEKPRRYTEEKLRGSPW